MFNNPFSMVVAIVAIVAIASIIRARYGLDASQRRSAGEGDRDAPSAAEVSALRDEIRALKERVGRLERPDDRDS